MIATWSVHDQSRDQCMISPLDKNPIPGHLSELQPVNAVNTKGQFFRASFGKKQHARLPCPSPTPRACSNSCPLSQWCHPTISSSVTPFTSCPQSSPASGSFPVNQLFTSGDHSIGISASASVLLMNIQDWFPLGWTGWISLQSKGLSIVLSQHYNSKASILQHSAFFIVQLSHPYVTTGKTIALTRQIFVGKVVCAF